MGTWHWLFTADKPECAYVVVLHRCFSVACYSYSDAPSILLYVRQTKYLTQEGNCLKYLFCPEHDPYSLTAAF